MKQLSILLAVLFLSFAGFAQPQATEGTAEFQKTTQPAAVIELPYAENVVEKAIADYMMKKGSKGNDSKGFKTFRGYKLRDSQDYTSDLYFKIDRKSRKEKDVTVVSLVVGKNGEDVKARVAPDNSSLDGAKDLLNDMVPSIDAYNLEVQIQDQEDVLKKSQKKYDGLVDDQKDYEKKIKNLQDKLEENKKDQEKQSDEVKKQQSILDTLKGKRKGS
ncbi:MAG: hypothetical protein KGO82_07955 [Bacteroidota bacterium]|nr:hypothetical protein [Bacteroidota bacterium]